MERRWEKRMSYRQRAREGETRWETRVWGGRERGRESLLQLTVIRLSLLGDEWKQMRKETERERSEWASTLPTPSLGHTCTQWSKELPGTKTFHIKPQNTALVCEIIFLHSYLH